MKLIDKVAVITGAGSGFGRETSELFAQEGAKIVVADLNTDNGRQTVEHIQKSGGEAVFVKVDVTNLHEVKEMIETAVLRFGRLDILFNNAGCPQPLTLIEYLEEEAFDLVMNVNVKGVFLGSKYAIPIFKQQKSGVIINTSSLNGIRPRSGLNVYSASKAAVIALTKAMALELAEFNIRCNCICPAAAETPMLDSFIGDHDKNAERQSMQTRIPMGRLVTPRDVATSALYLATDDSAMVTGMALTVDGGRGI
jgi:3-oxoacyl-[acyl-carrier protein] reductase